MRNPDRKIVVMWLIAVALITSRELKAKDRPLGLPYPSAYTGSAIVYGAAAIVAEFAPDLAVVAAAGWTLAIGYRSLAPSQGGDAATGVGQVKGTVQTIGGKK